LLLHYLPLQPSSWEKELKTKRELYNTFINDLLIDPHKGEKEEEEEDHPLNQSTDSAWNTFFKNNETLAEIEKDVKRTFPHLHFFNSESEKGETRHYEALRRILFIYAKLNPGIHYVQGEGFEGGFGVLMVGFFFCRDE